MKIVLVTCPNFALTPLGFRPEPYIPIGLLSISTVAKNLGHEVLIFDINQILKNKELEFNHNFSRNIALCLANEKPDLIGFSTMCNSYPLTIRMAKECHELCPKAFITLGGPYASVVDKLTLENFGFINSIIRGEAEVVFEQFLNFLEGKQTENNLLGITTIYNSEIKRYPDPPLIQDLDTLPFPDYKSFPLDNFNRIPIEAGRGCPFSCTFCSTNLYFNKKYRVKSPNRLVQEIEYLMQHTDVKHFDLVHDMFTIDKKFVSSFCELLIEKKLEISWGCSARVDCVDKDLLNLMGKSGCTGLFFGIETGSSRMQGIIKKKLDIKKVVPILKEAKMNGIRPTASFIIGYPDEKIMDIFYSIKLSLELAIKGITRIHFHTLAPLPGTPLTEEYFDKLKYWPVHSDITWSILQKSDKKLILKHKKIFVSFYSYPLKHIYRIYIFLAIIFIYLFVGPVYFYQEFSNRKRSFKRKPLTKPIFPIFK